MVCMCMCVSYVGLRQLCSHFCQLFYSSLPKSVLDDSLDLVRLFFQKKWLLHIILSYTVHQYIPSNKKDCQVSVLIEPQQEWCFNIVLEGMALLWTERIFQQEKYSLSDAVDDGRISNICQSGWLQTIQQRDHLWAWVSFTRVHLTIRFYLTCVGTEICTVTGM